MSLNFLDLSFSFPFLLSCFCYSFCAEKWQWHIWSRIASLTLGTKWTQRQNHFCKYTWTLQHKRFLLLFDKFHFFPFCPSVFNFLFINIANFWNALRHQSKLEALSHWYKTLFWTLRRNWCSKDNKGIWVSFIW